MVKPPHVKRGRPTTSASTAVPSDIVKSQHVKRGRPTARASTAVPSDMLKPRHVKRGRPTTGASTAVPSDIVKSQHVKRGRPTTRASTAVPSDMVKPRHVKRGRPTTRASAAVPSDMVKPRNVKRGRPTTSASTSVPSGKHSAEPKFQQPEHVAPILKWWDDTFQEKIANDNRNFNYNVVDRKECIDDHYEKKREFQQHSAIMLKKIVDMVQVSTYQETIQEIIGGRLTDSAVLKAVSDYIVTWLSRTSHLLGKLTELEVWDEEIFEMIIVCIGELNDVGIVFPELKNILVLVNACLKKNQQDNNVIRSFMAKALKDVVYEWHVNTCQGVRSMMTRWSKNPTPTFEIPKQKLPYSV